MKTVYELLIVKDLEGESSEVFNCIILGFSRKGT
jgi:hypothetical protein